MKKTAECRRSTLAAAILFIVLLLVNSMSSGIYVTVCALAPIGVVYLGYKFFRWEKIPGRSLCLLGATFLCVLLGVLVNAAVIGASKASGMVFSSVYQMLSNISTCFFGLFELLGGYTTAFDVPVVSMQGILLLGKNLLVAIFLICGVIALMKCIKMKGDLRTMLLLSVCIWNYYILSLMDMRGGSGTYEYRYHLLGMLPLMCVAVSVVVSGFLELQLKQQHVLFAGGFVLLLILSGLSFRELYTWEDEKIELKELSQYFKDMDLDVIYMYLASDDADICRLLDENHLYLSLEDDGTTWANDYYSRYSEFALHTENVVVAVYDHDDYRGDSFFIAGRELIKFDEIGGRSLYYFMTE